MEHKEKAQERFEKFEQAFDQVGDYCESVDAKIESSFTKYSPVFDARQKRAFEELSDCRSQNFKHDSASELYCAFVQRYLNDTFRMLEQAKKSNAPPIVLARIIHRFKFANSIRLPEVHHPQVIRTNFEKVEALTDENDMHAYVYIGKWKIKRDISSTKFEKCVGARGALPSQFLELRGIAVHPATQEVYAADAENRIIQVFSPNLVYLRSFCSCIPSKNRPSLIQAPKSFLSFFKKSAGNKNDNSTSVQDKFQKFVEKFSPSGLCFSHDGQICAVVDRTNNTAHIFNQREKCDVILVGDDDTPGQFDGIYTAAFDSKNFLYIPDCGNSRIQKYQSDGTFVKTICSLEESGMISSPSGIVITPSDEIYVSFQGSELVSVYNTEGVLQRSLNIEYTGGSSLGLGPNNMIFLVDKWNKAVFFTPDGIIKKKLLLERTGGIAFNLKNRMIVSEVANSKISAYEVLWDLDSIDHPIRSIKYSGNEPQRLSCPMSVCIHPTTDEIFVIDVSIRNVSVFCPTTFKFLRYLELQEGESLPHSGNPRDIAISGDGTMIAICDNYCQYLVVYDINGKFLRSTGAAGKPERFEGIGKLTFDQHDNIYVTEWNRRRIHMFDINLKFIRFLGNLNGNPLANTPDGITLNDSNQIIVAFRESPQVTFYSTTTGEVVRNLILNHVRDLYITRGPDCGFVISNKYSASGGKSGQVFLCSEDGRIVKVLEIHSPTGVCFNRHGRLIIASSMSKTVYEF